MGQTGATALDLALMKAEDWRLDPAIYPFWLDISTRFGDMDVNGHLNNVAFAQFFEDARVSFNRMLLFDGGWLDPAQRRFRVLVAGVDIAYVREGSYGPPVRVGIGVSRIGATSFGLGAAVFQHGVCLAAHESAIVIKSDGPMPEGLQARLAANQLKRSA